MSPTSAFNEAKKNNERKWMRHDGARRSPLKGKTAGKLKDRMTHLPLLPAEVWLHIIGFTDRREFAHSKLPIVDRTSFSLLFAARMSVTESDSLRA